MTIENIEFRSGAVDAGGCISEGWELAKQHYWLYFASILLAFIALGCIPIANFFLMGPMLCGIYFLFLSGLRGETPEIGMVFKGFERFIPAMVVGIIGSIPGIIDFVVQMGFVAVQVMAEINRDSAMKATVEALAIPMMGLRLFFILAGVVLYFGLFFAYPLVIDKGLSALDAIKLSFRALKANIGGMILLLIFTILLSFAGMLACIIGMIFVIPIQWAANAIAYRQVFPDTQPNLDFKPPQPNQYPDLNPQGL